jgi:hypothetical protein
MLGIKKLLTSCPKAGVDQTFLITSFHDHLVSKKLIASSQSRGRTPLDSTLLLCFVQSRLHLPLTAHCKFYIRRPTSNPPKNYKYYVFGHYPSSCPFFKKHNVSETGFCFRPQVKPTQLDPIDRASPYLRTPML